MREYDEFDKYMGSYSLRRDGDDLLNDKYSIIYGDKSSSKNTYLDDYMKIFSSKKKYSYEKEVPETEQEKSARLLREKAIERENKIDKLLGDEGL